jgi:hypothetical protein
MRKAIQGILAAFISLGCSGSDGADGAPGTDGVNGVNGVNGSSCHVRDSEDGTTTIFCDDGSEAVVSDGQDGTDGNNGADGADGTNGRDGEDGERGDPGEPGEDGEKGDPGEDGSNAEATRIAESFFCTGGLESTALGFTYNAVLLSSGDLFVTGSVNNALNSATDTKYYAPSQAGYQTAAVSMRYDQDGTADGGWFSLSLNRASLVTLIEYHQSDAGPVALTWTMLPAACVHNTY